MSAAVWWQAQSLPADLALAAELGIQVVATRPARGFYLARDALGVGLYNAGETGAYPLRARLGRAGAFGKRAPLARACGLHRHPPARVVDATCGLAGDAAALCALGASVVACERHPALVALVRAARAEPDLASQGLHNLDGPHCVDTRAALADWLAPPPDIVVIDPMFDAPRRKARPGKEMAWLAELVGADTDCAQLLAAARRTARRRVVVKSHARALPLTPPDLQVAGRAVRFDVYLTPPSEARE